MHETILYLGEIWHSRIQQLATAVREVFNSIPQIDGVPIDEPILYLWGAAKFGDLDVYRLFEDNIKDKNPVMQENRYNLLLIDQVAAVIF